MHTEIKWVIRCDGQEIECTAESFGPQFQELLDQLGQQGRQIISMVLDGKELPPDQPVQIDAKNGGELEIQTQVPDISVEEVLETATEYLPRLREGIVKIASLYQAGSEYDGNELLRNALEGLVWVGTCVGGLAGYGTPDWNAQMDQASDLYEEQLGRFFSALDRMDFTELADLLEYELAETISSMEQLIALVHSQEKEQV